MQILKVVFGISYLISSYFVASLLLLLLPFLYQLQSIAFHFDPVGVSREQVVMATQNAYQIVLKGQVQATPFQASEVSHLQDVHRVLMAWWAVGICSLVLAGGLGRKLSRVQQLPHFSRKYILIWLGLTVVLAFSFSSFFEAFHQVVFPQGNYAFPPDSLLIQIFPESFWLLLFVTLQVIVIMLWEAGNWVVKRKRL